MGITKQRLIKFSTFETLTRNRQVYAMQRAITIPSMQRPRWHIRNLMQAKSLNSRDRKMATICRLTGNENPAAMTEYMKIIAPSYVDFITIQDSHNDDISERSVEVFLENTSVNDALNMILSLAMHKIFPNIFIACSDFNTVSVNFFYPTRINTFDERSCT